MKYPYIFALYGCGPKGRTGQVDWIYGDVYYGIVSISSNVKKVYDGKYAYYTFQVAPIEGWSKLQEGML